MSQPQELTLQLADYQLAGLVWNPEAATPIVAIHGWLDNAASFSELAPLLPDYRLIALDLPGHGHSDHLRADDPLTLHRAIELILQALDALNIHKAILLGHSMGAGILTMLAALDPERVKKLILLDALGSFSAELLMQDTPLTQAYNLFLFSEQRPLRLYDQKEELVVLRARINRVPSETIMPLVERALVEENNGYRWCYDTKLRLQNMSQHTEQEILELFGRIQAPTLLIMPTAGLINKHPMMPAREAAVPNIAIVPIEAGHHAHLSHAREVAQLVNNFLS